MMMNINNLTMATIHLILNNSLVVVTLVASMIRTLPQAIDLITMAY